MPSNNLPNLIARDSKDNAVTTLTLGLSAGVRIEGLRLNISFTSKPTAPKVATLYSLSAGAAQTLLTEFVIGTSDSHSFDIEGHFSLIGESLVCSIPASGVDGVLVKSTLTGKQMY